MSKYFLDITGYKYNPEALFVVAIKHRRLWKSWAEAGHARKGYDVLRLSERVPYLDEISAPFADSGRFILERTSFVRFPPNYRITPHRDVGEVETGPRQCALIFPISPRPSVAPISWHADDGTVVEQHAYSFDYPTLINTQEPHSVQNFGLERICFQLSFYEPFAILAERFSKISRIEGVQ